MYPGADYSNTIYTGIVDGNSNPINFSGYTINARFTEDFQSNTVYAWVASGTSNSGIILTMNAASTANVPATNQGSRYFYDVFGYDPIANATSKILEGILTVYPSVVP